VVVVQTDLKIQMVELEQVGKVMLVGVPHLIRVVLHLMVLVAAAGLEQLAVLAQAPKVVMEVQDLHHL
jgi:hypothetical protein